MSDTRTPPIGAMEIVLAVVVLLACSMTLATTALGDLSGVGGVTRPLLGLVGTAGAVLLLTRRPQWIILLAGWSAVQIPVVIIDASGSLTNQALHFGMSWTQSRSVNGVVVSATGHGFNVVGAVFLIWIYLVWRSQKSRRASDARRDANETAAQFE